jgi:hypothetical protein
MSHLATRRQIARIFARLTRAGAASGAPTKAKANEKAERTQRRQRFQISDLRFQIEETATAKTKAKANADPSRLKGVRDDSGELVEAYFSKRSDSVGWSWAARFAGRYPKISPVEQETTNAITTEIHDIEM